MISFAPLSTTDLAQLVDWLNRPHVLEWWDDNLTPAEMKEKYASRIGDDIVVPFIIHLENKPIGFIQYYIANKVGDGWWPDEQEGTVGMDLFIGEEDYLNKGYGTRIIHLFAKKLFTNPSINKIIIDVDPNNQRAIRCYEKAGFVWVKEIETPDGKAMLLEMLADSDTISTG